MDFLKRHNDLYNERLVLINEAKLFIDKNCHRVDDWTEMSLCVKNGNTVDNSNKLQEGVYHSASAIALNNKERAKQEANGLPRHWLDIGDDHLGIITSLTVEFDQIDYDISFTINNLDWWWVDEATVIQISDFIENALDRKRKIDALVG